MNTELRVEFKIPWKEWTVSFFPHLYHIWFKLYNKKQNSFIKLSLSIWYFI